jgi:hypothetical protein
LLIDAECEPSVYVYAGAVVPYIADVPESTHVTAAIALNSVRLFVVASHPVSVRTTELALPVPHTVEPAAVP